MTLGRIPVTRPRRLGSRMARSVLLFGTALVFAAGAQCPAQSAPGTLRQAQHLFDQHRFAQARALLENIVAANPSADAYMLLADVAREQSDFAVTMGSLRKAAKLDPQREDAYLEFSEICGDHGNAQLALDAAEIGLSHLPGSYRLKIQKGVALDRLGRYDDAVQILKEAGAQQAENSLASLSLALVLTHANRLDDADQLLAEALKQFPQNASMHYYRGKLLLQKAGAGNDGEPLRAIAQQEFSASLRIDPTRADAWYQISTLYSTDQVEQAEGALRHCLKLDPEHAPAQYALARICIRKGNKAEGEAMLARYKARQRAAELEQNKTLRIDVAQR